MNETTAGIKDEGEFPIVKEETSLESNKTEKNTAQKKILTLQPKRKDRHQIQNQKKTPAV